MFRTKRVWFFLAPGLALLLVFYVIPFFGGIRYSLQDGSFSNQFVGLENYLNLWKNELFQLGLKNTLQLSFLCAPLLWLMSFSLASVLADLYPRGSFARSAVMLPYLAPASAMILIWQVFFDYGGTLNRFLALLNTDRILWLSTAMRFPVIVMFLWKNWGLCTIIFLAAIRSVPSSCYESAALDGISPLRRNISITLPLVSPCAYLVFIISWINAFRIFRETYFISGAYPQDDSVYTLQHYMNNVYSSLNYQKVTAAAYSFAAIVLLLFAVLFFLQQRSANEING